MKKSIDDLWLEYRATGTRVARDRLVLGYMGLVRQVAWCMSITPSVVIDYKDTVIAGIFGLIKAIEKFDPDRGFKFETYAAYKVRGAILDELRALDWVPRSAREAGETPSVVEFDEDLPEIEGFNPAREPVADGALAGALAQLSENERRLIALYHGDELPLSDVGAALGVSESRASQMHSEIISKLRRALAVNQPTMEACQ